MNGILKRLLIVAGVIALVFIFDAYPLSFASVFLTLAFMIGTVLVVLCAGVLGFYFVHWIVKGKWEI